MEAAKPITSMEITDIQRRMARIRHDMHQEVQGAVKGAQSLTDWRGFVIGHPWLAISVASIVGYLVVPKRRVENPTIVNVGPPSPDLNVATAQRSQAAIAPRTRSSTLGTAFALLAPIVVRAGQNYALSYLEAWLAQHPLSPGSSGTQPGSTQSHPTRSDPSPRIREFR